MSKPTVFIVDHDLVARDSLATMIESMELEVECHASAEDFLASYDATRSGCLVSEIDLPGISGIDLHQQMISREILLPVIFLVGSASLEQSVKTMKQGAIDFLEKPYRPVPLQAIIREAIALDEENRRKSEQRRDIEAMLSRLNENERAVLGRVMTGETSRVIASRLGISLRTVQLRRSSIKRKLNVESWSDLMELLVHLDI